MLLNDIFILFLLIDRSPSPRVRTPIEERQFRATSSSVMASGSAGREEEEEREVRQSSVSSMTQAGKEEEEDDWMEQEMKKARYV